MLIICSECGKEFSNKAPACPNCGCPTELIELQTKDTNIDYERIRKEMNILDNYVELAEQKMLGKHEEAVRFIMTKTNCDESIAKDVYLDLTKNIKEKTMSSSANLLHCPYCHSTLVSQNMKVDLLGDMILGKNMFLRERKQWHCYNCGSDF